MVPAASPVISLVKLPTPEPSSVLLSFMSGFTDVLQQTPRAVTEEPPSDVTFPPLDALIEVIDDIVLVTTVGAVTIGLISHL